MATAVRGAPAPKDSYRYIYAYCNLRTNQVLYSLHRHLKNTTLKQLPDTGANNTPPALRKDLWLPLWTVEFPNGKAGLQQALHAFQRLREWRKLHETNWEPPPQLSRPFSEEEIVDMKKKLEDRGGSKEENVWDIIRRKKKKLRVATVLDQKANSIADLAAVLSEQEELGVKMAENKQILKVKNREREVKLFLELAKEEEQGALQRLEQRFVELEAFLATSEPGEPGSALDISKRRAQREFANVRARRTKMTFAADSVRKARQSILAAKEKKRAGEATAATGGATNNTNVESCKPVVADAASSETELASPPVEEEDDLTLLARYLPSFPLPDMSELHKRSPILSRLKRASKPVFKTDSVSVQWNNILDAEFAPSWPENVDHKSMGVIRHTAPDPRKEPILDVGSEFAERQAKLVAKKERLVALRERKRKELARNERKAASMTEEILELTRKPWMKKSPSVAGGDAFVVAREADRRSRATA